jgi:hypothetical protein
VQYVRYSTGRKIKYFIVFIVIVYRSKNLQGCAGKTVPEYAAAGWGVRSKRTSRHSRVCGGGGVQTGASAGGRGLCRRAGVAGLEAGGRDLVLLASYLELEGAQAALDDRVRAVVERCERRHMAAAADPDAVRGPQVRRQVLWQLSVHCNVSRQRRIV